MVGAPSNAPKATTRAASRWYSDVLLEDPTLVNRPLDGAPRSHQHRREAPEHIAATRQPNTTADPDSCENATFVDSIYEGGDDGVAIKSGWDCFGLDVARPSRNTVLRNLTIRSPNAAGICIE